jgi:hypothetical protein
MRRSPSKETRDRDKLIEDEPGAGQRFSRILKRALSTPPQRKKAASTSKPALATGSDKHRKDSG